MLIKDEAQMKRTKHWYLRYTERISQCVANISNHGPRKQLVYKHLHVFDMDGCSVLKVKRAAGIIGFLIKAGQSVYPETLHKCYLINCGWVFRAIWTLLSYFIDPLTIKKIAIVGANWKEEMQKDG